MNQTNQTYVLYHANCMDGFGAALAAWMCLGDEARYLPVEYHKPVPVMEDGSDVFIVDFSYPAAELSALGDRMRVVIVLDHHHTAQKDLAGLSHPRVQVEFNNEKSGAVMTWEFFFPPSGDSTTTVPLLLRYVQDRDLWQWLLPESREVSAALASYERDFHTWLKLLDEDGVELLRQEGRVALRVTAQMARSLAETAEPATIGGYEVPSINSPVLNSEICHEMLGLHPEAKFVACWFEEEGKRAWRLRSRPDFDCSRIAKAYGGGGHAQACGFTEMRNGEWGVRNGAAELAQTGGVLAIAAERRRQILEKGWSATHDDELEDGELARAAAAFALRSTETIELAALGNGLWPWDGLPLAATPRRALEKAGALIAAEIDRLDRAEKGSRGGAEGAEEEA